MAIEKRRITPDGFEAPLLGLGGMRMPDISQKKATAIINRAVELGVKYIETSPGYGDSEEKIGIAVEELGCRNRVYISTKSSRRGGAELRENFERSLARLRTDRFDFYHMWFVNDMDAFNALMSKGGALEEAKRLRDEGYFKRLGITTHAGNDDIRHFIDTGEFELVTLYYNAYDTGVEEVVQYAWGKGLGVVAMGPLKGGFLSSDNTEKMAFLRDEHAETNAQGALRWLAADERVSVLAVGYTEVEHVEQAYKAVTGPRMTPGKREEIVRGLKAFEKHKKEICSCCDYCKEHCPQGLPISSILTYLAQYEIYGIKEFAARRYNGLKTKGDACTACGACLEHCPQKLNIPELIEKAHATLGGG
ncbi:MAG: aldo/keto reductase [Planctomycetes bacterium]|nr:aldo/keto reductase [Planctomycetota bacterium]